MHRKYMSSAKFKAWSSQKCLSMDYYRPDMSDLLPT